MQMSISEVACMWAPLFSCHCKIVAAFRWCAHCTSNCSSPKTEFVGSICSLVLFQSNARSLPNVWCSAQSGNELLGFQCLCLHLENFAVQVLPVMYCLANKSKSSYFLKHLNCKLHATSQLFWCDFFFRVRWAAFFINCKISQFRCPSEDIIYILWRKSIFNSYRILTGT